MIVSSAKHVDRGPPVDALVDFLRPFESAFRRRDQVRWFHLYLRGLLAPGPRKTIEAMVRDVEPTLETPGGDLSQSIQNFLNQSPWDERILWRELRRRAATRGPCVGVIEETGIVKQGQHSVGVHRQYAGDHDRKQNCQVVSLVMGVWPTGATTFGAAPLGCRLYLPRNWASDPERLDAAGVPESHRAVASRGQVSLGLLEEIERDGVRFQGLVAASRHGAARELREALLRRDAPLLVRVDDDVPVQPTGRSTAVPIHEVLPRGAWTDVEATRINGERVQHQEMPLWAITQRSQDRRTFYLGRVHDLSEAADRLRQRRTSADCVHAVKTRFGLDHFEGRSWRGFHHHAALVGLAYWFSFLESERDQVSQDLIF